MIFCNDADLLYWEPDVMKDAAFASQTLDAGTGTLAGTTFTMVTGTVFTTQAVEPGNVIVLSGAVVGCFPIVAVPDPSYLQLSVLHEEMFPAAGEPAPTLVSPGGATGVDFVIRSFWPQRRVVSDLLAQAIGLSPGTSEASCATILNPQTLRRACVLGTLQMIYSAMAAVADEPAKYSLRADLYERLYRRAMRQAQVDLDLNGDGRADVRRSPGLLRMVRV
jgi:hypothetical protein